MQVAAFSFHICDSSFFVRRLDAEMQRVVLPHMSSKGNTVKYHKLMNHSVDAIRAHGSMCHYSSNFYEAQHQFLKLLYK